MSTVFAGRKPERLYQFLNDVFSIPRPSGHEEQIAGYVLRFAKAKGLRAVTDGMHNVLVYKPGSAGMERLAPVLLEGHLDMVAAKEPQSVHDFLKDPIRVCVRDGWAYADGTTLGADNGCAVAMMLALLDDDTLMHPPLECLFTASEETGYDGIKAFDFSWIHARRAIGLDAGSEGVFRKGVSTKYKNEFVLPIVRENADGQRAVVEVSGLRGGSPSMAIPWDRACAIRLMGRLLHALTCQCGARIVWADKRQNPGLAQDCRAEILLPENTLDAARALIQAQQASLRAEYRQTDPDIALSLTPAAASAPAPMDPPSSARLAALLYLMPFGAPRRVAGRCDEPRVCLCARTVQTQDDQVRITTWISADLQAIGLAQQQEIETFFEIFGARCTGRQIDPGWDPQPDSPLRETMRQTYAALFGREPVVNVSHGGNDCVVLKQRLPEMDVVTTAATYLDYHTPRERLDLESFEKVYLLLTRTLAQLCR